MIEKKTVIDQVELTRSGAIQIRFAKLIVEDGVEISRQWHRTAVDFYGNVDDQMTAVNAHLVSMNESPVDQTEIDDLKDYFSLYKSTLTKRGKVPSREKSAQFDV